MLFRRPTKNAAPPRPAYMDQIDAADLYDFQRVQLAGTIKVLEELYPKAADRERVEVLDVGCNPTQDRILSQFVKHVTGTNVGGMENVPGDAKTKFLNSGEVKQPFEDGTFDFAFSLSVMEHLNDTRAVMAEHVRVLKPGGYGYVEWCCQWGCYAGHHIFAILVRDWEKYLKLPRSPFEDGGDFVPDWGHLLLTPDEMRKLLCRKLGPGFEKLADVIVDVIYFRTDEHGLARLYLGEVMDIIRSFDVEIVEFTRQEVKAPKAVKEILRAKHGDHDYDAHYAKVIFRKLEGPSRPADRSSTELAEAAR